MPGVMSAIVRFVYALLDGNLMVKSCLVSVFHCCLSEEWAKWQNTSSWGPGLLFDLHVDTSAPRGRTLDGGTIWSLGIKVPRGDSSGEGRAAHGPLHPAVNRSLETWMAALFVFLLWSWFCHLVDCIAFLSLGLVYCMGFEPFKPRPVFGFCMCPSSSLLYGWFRRRRVSSSLSLRRWGNPNPLRGVWGSPCVSASWPRSSSWIRTPCSASTPRLRPRTCVFFFFRVVVVRWLCGGRSRFCSVSLGLAVCVVVFFFLHAHVMLLQEIRGSQTIIWRPYYYYHHVLGQSENPHPVAPPEPLSGLHSPHPLPVERCKGQPRKGVGDRIGRQAYCHTLLGTSICFLPLLKGEMLSVFFHFVFFCVWLGVFCRFFRSSLLRVAV